MAVNLSPVGGVAAQFFTNNGTPLAGGKIYTYSAGTTTPATTYTSSQGNVQWTNPIVLNAGGRVPSGGEIWLTDGINYKFVLKDANDVTIATYDNISGINSSFVAYTNQQEIQVATAGQTVFNLSTMSYQVGTNSLSVFVDGVNQYGPGAQYAYTETDDNTVTFTNGLHVGAVVKFTTSQQQGAGAVDASQVSYTPPFVDSVPTNVEAKLAEYVSITDFGADPTGVASSYQAFVDALAASNAVYVPAGTYLIDQQIDITGNKTIYGLGGNNTEALPSGINFTAASGNCFSATSAEFGGITIRNLSFIGGNGQYAIRSSRPQSVFENLKMEPYDGGGIELFEAGTASQASWGTAIRNVKWVGPLTPTAYRGFQVKLNGGHLTLERCIAVHGSIGLNIDQGEAINVIACNFNQQNSTYSSLTAADQCAIRLSGAGYKRGISIRSSYLETCTYAIYVDKCESLSIEDNYIADSGVNSNYASIYLQDAVSDVVNNVTIRNNMINDAGQNSASIDIGDYAKNVVVENNYISSAGSNSIGIRKGTQYYSWICNNDIQVNISTGTEISDPNRLIVNTDYQQQGFFNGRYNGQTFLPNTWYDVAPVGNSQIWSLVIVRTNDPTTWRRKDDLFITNTGTATFVNTYNVNPGYDTTEWRVSGGILQFRVVGSTNTFQTVSAIRLA